MILVTKELSKKIPALYSQEFNKDQVALVKLFSPWGNWTWYITEKSDDICFGLVVGQETELGYFSLKELESINGPFGLKIERDKYFDPTPLSKLRK
jgi:hypothetical protein